MSVWQGDRVEGGDPLVFVNEGKEMVEGGTVTYVPGMNGGRAQASLVRHSLAKGQGPPAKDGVTEVTSRWIDRLVEDSNMIVSEAMGSAKEVQTALLLGASSDWELEEVPAKVVDKHHGREADEGK